MGTGEDDDGAWCRFDVSVLTFGKAQNSTVLYSCLFACALHLTIVRFVKRARNRALVTGDESAAIAVILPSYLPILYGAILENLFRAVVVVLYGGICHSAYIDLYPERSAENGWNNVLYAGYTCSFEWFAHGFILLFRERCVSYRSLAASVLKGLLLSIITTTLYVLGLNYHMIRGGKKEHSNFYNSLQLMALSLPLMVLLLPMLYYRKVRSTALPFLWYSILWRVVYVGVVIFTWISYSIENNHGDDDVDGDGNGRTVGDVSNHHLLPISLLVVILFFRDILSPFFVYLSLLRDTHYWRGLPRRKILEQYNNDRQPPWSNARSTIHSLRLTTPLLGQIHGNDDQSLRLGTAEMDDDRSQSEDVTTWLAQPRYPPGDRASNRLQNLLDTVPVQAYIDFAFLQVDYSRLLGRGGTASVFVGMLTLQNQYDRSNLVVSLSPTAAGGNQNQTSTRQREYSNASSASFRSVASSSAPTGEASSEIQPTDNSSLATFNFQTPASSPISMSTVAYESEQQQHQQAQEESTQAKLVKKLSMRMRDMELAATSLIKRFLPSSLRDTEDGILASATPSATSSPRHLLVIDDDEIEMDFQSVSNNSTPLMRDGRFGGGGELTITTTSDGGRKIPVAIKMYTPPELDVDTIEAYAKETEILTELNHPNVVPYYGLCVNPPHLCLVFDLCPQGSLEDYIIANVRWPVERRLSIILDCVRALAYIHKKGYVHRDIKPGNFLLNESFRCMLTDFGTCVRVAEGQKFVKTDSIAGTIDHMAPEVLSQTRRNMFYGYPSDMYSIGIVVCSILSMSMPYQGIGAFKIRKAVLSGQRPTLPQCPQALRAVVQSAWHQDPMERISASNMLHIISGIHVQEERALFECS